MKRAGLVAVVVALAFLAGCGGGAGDGLSSTEKAIRKNLLRLAQGWEDEDQAPFYAYYSEDYNFDGVGKEDHLQSIFGDFPYIRNWDLTEYDIDVQSATYALVEMRFSMELFADISALDQPAPIEEWVISVNRLSQVWQRDFDGVWRVVAEYLAAAWVLNNRPSIGDFSVLPGDEFIAGSLYDISARGTEPNSTYRVTLFPDSLAADYFDPEYVYGWRSADYFGGFGVSDTAFGEYALSFIGQSDRPPQTTMVGRRIDAVFIVVSDRSGQKPVRKYLPPTGIRKSVFRALRIHGSAGQSVCPQLPSQ